MSARLTCAFGTDWIACIGHPCPKCRAYADELERQFWRDVFFGKYDAQGYELHRVSGERLK